MALVNFFSEDIEFDLDHPRKTSTWIKKIVQLEKRSILSLNFIFCSDEFLRQMNLKYLNHTTYTDIVTFDNSEGGGLLEGDIFISIERVNDNSTKFNTSFDEELHRVIIHGVLHLLGFSDKTPKDKITMRDKEDACLSLR